MNDPHSTENEPVSEMTDEARQVIGKARRSFGVSMLILMAGLLAVAGALVYRVNRDASPVDQYALSEIRVPSGAVTLSVVPANGMFSVTYSLGELTMVRLIDAADGAVLKDIPVVSGN